jgi:predicted CopG family antitoxin
MPKRGFKTVTVPEQVYSELEKFAKERFTTVPKIVEYLISKEKGGEKLEE